MSCSTRGVDATEITVFDERDGGTFFGFADPDATRERWGSYGCAEKPLIPHEARGRFGASEASPDG